MKPKEITKLLTLMKLLGLIELTEHRGECQRLADGLGGRIFIRLAAEICSFDDDFDETVAATKS